MKLIYCSLLALTVVLSGCSKKSEGETSNPQQKTEEDTVQPGNNGGDIYNGTAVGSGDNNTTPIKTDWPPSIELITADLTDHTLEEGSETAYHDKNWTYTIQYGDVSNLKIDEVLTNTDSKYLVVASMDLKGGNNYFYEAKARINYVRDKNGAPVLDYIKSLGIKIICDNEYTDDITPEISSYGNLILRNNGEVALWVGGKYLDHSDWNYFSRNVPPHDRVSISYSVKDFRIDFVARDH